MTLKIENYDKMMENFLKLKTFYNFFYVKGDLRYSCE